MEEYMIKTFITQITIIVTACFLAGCAIESHASTTGKGDTAATSKPVKTILTAERLREDFLDWKFGMFIHFNVATFNERQWATGCEDPGSFTPDKLDCNQWVDAAAAAGMKYAVLTVKHTGGWCLWNSKHTTSHDMTAFKNYKNGKGDIVREFVDACRKRRIKVGFYYCFPGDFAKRHLPKGKEDLLHGLPPEAKADYAGFIKKQLSELLTGYGPIDLIWADQYSNSYTRDDWLEIKRHIKSLQPNCIVIANNSLNFRDTDIHSYEYPWLKNARPARALPPEDNEHPAEVCDKIGPGWFWSTKENNANVKSAEEVMDMLKLCNSRRANYLLNVSPDRSGLIPDYSVKRLTQVGKLLAAKNQTGSSKSKKYHVSKAGLDTNPGTKAKPFKTISAAAEVAKPGDTITVHEGVYRERINPPRGGTRDDKRIVYKSAKGQKVVIKGSELIKGWERIQNDTWKVVLPNSFFGDFNPFDDLISGDWFNPMGREHHTGAVYLNDHWLTEAAKHEDVLKPAGKDPLWFARIDDKNTMIWAQFKDVNPNEAKVEINVRQAVFYPEQTGMNYITVRGFTLMHAATNWAPPTAEQVGLIGTNWSKGWIIEDNDIRYSTCVGVTLGKHGDEFDNTSANSAEGYVETIKRGLANGWSKENIGHHVVRNNHISHCEQAGIVGSLGPVFSAVTNNTIHDIHVRRLFTGAEMAGIKFHGAVDTIISNNHIYRTCRGIWLDWMSQGTRVTQNLLHDNGPSEDIFVEVNHGPFVVDNNILLSPISLLVNSQGCAYAHNLITGRVRVLTGEGRKTPYLKEHSTEVAGLAENLSGDERYYNNLIVNKGLSEYDPVKLPMFMGGNVYLNGAKPSKHESDPLVLSAVDPGIKLLEKSDGFYLNIDCDKQLPLHQRRLVTTELLGKAKSPNLPYMDYDGSTLKIDIDYFGNKRNTNNPYPGPFDEPKEEKQLIKVWPKK
jgi:alpha-N-arabinofuranosidase